MALNEALDELKKTIDDAQKELKKADSLKAHVALFELGKTKLIQECAELEQKKKELVQKMADERKEWVVRMSGREQAVDTDRAFVEQQRKLVEMARIQNQADRTTLTNSMEEARKMKEEAQATIRLYNEKLQQFKSIASA